MTVTKYGKEAFAAGDILYETTIQCSTGRGTHFCPDFVSYRGLFACMLDTTEYTEKSAER